MTVDRDFLRARAKADIREFRREVIQALRYAAAFGIAERVAMGDMPTPENMNHLRKMASLVGGNQDWRAADENALAHVEVLGEAMRATL